MKKICDFITTNKHVILWTIYYFTIMWAVLYFLFDFNMFNERQWNHLLRAELHGFAGFVFGLLLLAAIPLYVATTTLIYRTKKPLIEAPKIKIPNFLSPAPAPAPQPTHEIPETPAPETTHELPDDIPAELRQAYIRAHNNLDRPQTSSFNKITPIHTVNDIPEPSFSMPLPSDFDISAETAEFNQNDEMPVFTDIDFDTPPPAIDNNNKMINHLIETGQEFDIENDIILTQTHAIASHLDPDFWVADDENWFAAGKTRPSPINALHTAATEHNLIPILYLQEKNILDIDKMIQGWTTEGITVITAPTEIQTNQQITTS